MGLGMLVDGKWRTKREQEDEKGSFVRPATTFRNQAIPETGRYHLYVSLACPWAQRTLIMRKLKGLDDAISLSIVDPHMGDDGWSFSEFPGCIPDSINNAQFLRDIYVKADPNFTGRVTVPVLWDKKEGTIVNNESREILRMFDTGFQEIAKNSISFYPEKLRDKIDQTIDQIYQPINNGVYRAGFATTQEAYEEAVTDLFDALNSWEEVLGNQRYLCGNVITEADWCMFTTLLRFDAVYYVHFKCNIRHLWDYPNLVNYLKDLSQQPGVKETCNMDHIKIHYYTSHPNVNPSGIVPKGPVIDLGSPHDRGRFF
ncbi:glutathione S-transferase family protein [Ancylothrix sp. C2]|uniref:glutathione S-transferase family protein n=1 Tax=Ancylothrix sp. D3o TaxID=2953691 RepID=UPI0021BAFF6F|nr:glutathione S-transferase family protein [Ancylothrix sp. D3o]MCT7949230.1 glutathione S-transferase family protein [Ancylothrix sp. D3o]